MQTIRDFILKPAWICDILQGLRDKRVATLLIEPTAKQVLQISDCGLVLKQGQTRIEDTAPRILDDARIAQLFRGDDLEPVVSVS